MIDIGLLSIQEAYDLRVAVNNIIEQHEKEALKVLNKGEKHPHFALKKGNKKRSFRDADKVVELLRDAGYNNKDIFDAKMKGIPALEKLVKGTDIDLDEHILVGYSKSTLVYTGEGNGK